MGTLALIFPGQGSQYPGMGQAIVARSPAAAAAFDEVDAALGFPLSDLAWHGEAADLDRTVNAQPALLATSIAYLRALQEALAARGTRLAASFHAGHSMGQYSAMVAAGVLTLPDAARLVRERGRLMQASGAGLEGAMAAVLGLPDERLADLETAGRAVGSFTIANRNSPGQIVVSGERTAVERAAAAARELGARRAVLLPVSVAAHSPLMAEAAEGMREALADVPFRDPASPLIANADGRPLTTGEACRAELVDHLTSGVDWVSAVRGMAAGGADTFLEVGPGRVLTGLVRRIVPDLRALATDDPDAPGQLVIPALTPPS